MKYPKLKILLTFLTVLSAQICFAQDTTKPWSLQDCITYAKSHNISLQQAQTDVQIAQDQKLAAKGQLLPSLNGSVSQNYNIGSNIDPITNVKKNQTTRSNGFGIGAGWNLFNGFYVLNGIKKASWDVLANKYQLHQQQHDLTIQIINDYLQILLNAEMLQTAKRQLQLSKKFQQDMQVLLQAGEKAKADLADANAQLANDRRLKIMAENNLEIARRDLAQDLQLHDITAFNIVYRLPILTDTTLSQRPLEQIYSRVLEKYPAVRQSEARIKSATLNWRMTKSNFWPNLSFSSGISTAYSDQYLNTNGTKIPFNQQFNDNLGHYFSFNLSIPIFNRLYNLSSTQMAKKEIKKAKLQQKQQQYALWQTLQTLYSNVNLYKRAWEVSREATQALDSTLSYALERYQSGTATYYDYLQARNNWLNARSQAIQNKYSYLYNAVSLKFYFEDHL